MIHQFSVNHELLKQIDPLRPHRRNLLPLQVLLVLVTDVDSGGQTVTEQQFGDEMLCRSESWSPACFDFCGGTLSVGGGICDEGGSGYGGSDRVCPGLSGAPLAAPHPACQTAGLSPPPKALLALIALSLRSNMPVLIVLKCNQGLHSRGANNLNLTKRLRRSAAGPSSPSPRGTNVFMCWKNSYCQAARSRTHRK